MTALKLLSKDSGADVLGGVGKGEDNLEDTHDAHSTPSTLPSLPQLAHESTLVALGHRYRTTLDAIALDNPDLVLTRKPSGAYFLTPKQAKNLLARHGHVRSTALKGVAFLCPVAESATADRAQVADVKYFVAACVDDKQAAGSGTNPEHAAVAAQLHDLLLAKASSTAAVPPTSASAQPAPTASVAPAPSPSARATHIKSIKWSPGDPWPPAYLPIPYVEIPAHPSMTRKPRPKGKRSVSPSSRVPATVEPANGHVQSSLSSSPAIGTSPAPPAKRVKRKHDTQQAAAGAQNGARSANDAQGGPAEAQSSRPNAVQAKRKAPAHPTFTDVIKNLQPYEPRVPAGMSPADLATPTPFDGQLTALRQALFETEHEYERLLRHDAKAMAGLARYQPGLDATLRLIEAYNHEHRRALRMASGSGEAAAAQLGALGFVEGTRGHLAKFEGMFAAWRRTLAGVAGSMEQAGEASADSGEAAAGTEVEVGGEVVEEGEGGSDE